MLLIVYVLGGEQTDTLKVTPADSVLFLTHRFIIPESLRFVNCNAPTELRLDAIRGVISCRLPENPPPIIVVTYRFLDLDLPMTTFINEPPSLYIPPQAGQVEQQLPADLSAAPSSVSYDFLKSGSIYRGITIGSRGSLSLHSGMNLELDGKLSEGISIQGVLSDQNLPIQPEGNTQTLEEIDKVYIRVKLPHEQLVFGDYELMFKDSQLGNYSRRLEGVQFASQRANHQTEAAGALTRGQYHSNYFLGEEGNQGPYQLVGRNGETAIIVLAGTEHVWINGELKQRGENYDYVIDYSTAEIKFTPRCLVTAAARITVDFQYSDLIYQKNVWALQHRQEWYDSQLNMTAGYIQESDDFNNPLEIELSARDRAYLKTIGDAVDRAFVSTIHPDSAGAYIICDSILKFVGVGQGTHTATFYNVGKKGRYKKVYSGDLTYFEYVDVHNPATPLSEIEQAQYLPQKPLPLPRQQQYFFGSAYYRPHQRLRIKGEFARSSLDRNRFSPLEDKNNVGLAYLLEANWQVPLGSKMQIELAGQWQAEDERFAPIDRLQKVEYHRLWNLPADSVSGYRTLSGSAGFNWQELFRINYHYGQLQRSFFTANRNALTVTGKYKFLEHYEFIQENIKSQRSESNSVSWLRQTGRLNVDAVYFRPVYVYQFEKQTGNDRILEDFSFSEHKLALQSREGQNWGWQIAGEWRRDAKHDTNGWYPTSIGQNLIFNSQWRQQKAFSGQCDYVYRQLRSYTNEPNQTMRMLNVLLNYDRLQTPFNGELVWKIESERAIKKERRYFYVGKGLGEFLYDSTFNDYVIHPYGDYILRILPTNIREPVTTLTHGFRWQFNGSSLDRESILNRLSTITDLRLEQKLRRSGSPYRYAAFSPAKVDSLFLYFNRQWLQDVIYRPEGWRAEWRLRYRMNDQISSLEVTGSEETSTNELTLNYRGSFIKRSNLESELTRRHYQRQSVYSLLRYRNIYSYRFKNVIAWAFDARNYLTTELSLLSDQQRTTTNISSFLTGLKWTYEHKIPRRGRWQAFLEFDQVAVNPRGSAIPYEMSDGKKEGLTIGWGISAEYRIGQNLTMRASYEGWREPIFPVYHIGSGEIRAYF